ncbi:hypothetical protein [Noviherbaspirillum pedocola]|uniref:Lipoprotein n=1 Tax=Noviherbaspirillum pedocola TaxID=2801341 RepID=A0A934SVF5_9BURK|nr:hypothetical protein [Noviherbaspirillum pedocola]MBK4736068.1 hypothetical protein [Noviherbaspirillum pedocola]
MGDTAIFDRQTVRGVVVGALSACAVLGCAALNQVRVENRQLHAELMQLRKQVESSKEKSAVQQAPKPAIAAASPVATASAVAPSVPLAVHPAEAAPDLAAAVQPGLAPELKFALDMLRPPDNVRPPLPLAIPPKMKGKSLPARPQAKEPFSAAPAVVDTKSSPVEAMPQLDSGPDTQATAPWQGSLSLLEQ